MLEQICAYIHNYFTERNGVPYGRHDGTHIITGGSLTVDGLEAGQYYRIDGSRFNDGVHVYGEADLTDETFTGTVWEMRPKKAFIDLVTEIEAWQQQYGAATAGPYQSEAFGGYSYSLKTTTNASGQQTAPNWQSTFKPRLDQWRKLA